jgi:hypothetical protein
MSDMFVGVTDNEWFKFLRERKRKPDAARLSALSPIDRSADGHATARN